MRSRTTLAILVAAALVSPPAHAITETLNPSKDNTLYEPIEKDAFEDRSNGAGIRMFTGRVKDANADPNGGFRVAVRRAVLAFDLSSIPAGSTINTVSLTLTAIRVKSNTSYNVSLHRLLSDWGEGISDTSNSQPGRGATPSLGDANTPADATWNHTFYDTQF